MRSIEDAVAATRNALRYLTRGESIISGVLRYLRPLTLRQRVVALRTLVKPVADELMHSWKELCIGLNNIPQDVTVCVDEESLRQVFEELFGNAVQARNGSGIIRVHASFIQMTQDNGRLVPAARLVVEDDGPGVPSQLVDRLFEPFVTGSAQGTGLGLAFVKRVIEEHGGFIKYEPVVPHGVRFIFVLPAVLEEHVNGA